MSGIFAGRAAVWAWRGVALAMGVLVAGGLGAGVVRGEGKGEYVFWPAAPGVPQVQFLTALGGAADDGVPKAGVANDTQKAGGGSEFGFAVVPERPYGIRMQDGKLYVCDAAAGTVTVVDFRKKETRQFGQNGQVKLSKPIDIAVAADGVKYVTDTGLGAVLVYDATDHYAGRIAVKDLRPVGVAVREKELYVADLSASQVRVFDRFNGKELRTIGEKGGGDGQFGGVYGLALDGQGNLLVNDIVACRLQKLSPAGKFAWGVGGLGDRPGQLIRPKLMAVDAANCVYVTDFAFQNVQVFDEKGGLVTVFGGAGGFPGAMEGPAGVCVSETDGELFGKYVHPAFEAKRLVFVTNNIGAEKINVYAMGELKAGKTVADIAAGRVEIPANAEVTSQPGK